ncbi:MAG: metallophosphoesterase family protein [Cyclobacteriaceae bacterium]
MKIGILSDTHNYLDPKIYKYFENVDELWHAGDIGNTELMDELEKFKPVRFVYGNIDGHLIRARAPEYELFEVGGLKVLMLHIGGKPPGYTKQASALIARLRPDIFVCGHSHILRVAHDPKRHKLLYINPGAAGIVGFHKVKTIIRFEISEGKVSNMQAIELGARAQKKP